MTKEVFTHSVSSAVMNADAMGGQSVAISIPSLLPLGHESEVSHIRGMLESTLAALKECDGVQTLSFVLVFIPEALRDAVAPIISNISSPT